MPTDGSGPAPAVLRHLVDAVGDVLDELVTRGRGRWPDRPSGGVPGAAGAAGSARRPRTAGTSGFSRTPGTSSSAGPAPGSAGAIRLSDAERDNAAAILRDAYAEGRLDLGEFEDRLTFVQAARVRAELPPILADLPGAATGAATGAGGLPGAGRGGFGSEGAGSDGPGSYGAGSSGAGEVVTAVLREVRRTGRWEVPPRLTVLVRGGTAVLDLREARVRSDVVEIDVRLTAGRVLVIVPPGVAVEVRDGLTVLGTRSERTIASRPGRRSAADPRATRVVIGGQIIAGRLVVRTPTLRERWRSS